MKNGPMRLIENETTTAMNMRDKLSEWRRVDCNSEGMETRARGGRGGKRTNAGD